MDPRRLLVLLALLVPTIASAQSVRAPRLHVLDNGLRVLTVEDHTTPLVTVTWSAHVGDSAEPPDFTGNSHYLEHLLLFRGTDRFPKNAIGEWVAGRGGYFNGHTWYDYTTFEIMGSPTDLDAMLERHRDMMFHAAFSGEDFELEKKAVFEELRAALDQPYGYLWMTAPYHMYPGETFYSRSTIGTIASVQAATVDRVRQYYKKYYVPNNMTLAVVGDIDTDDAVARVRALFGDVPPGDIPSALYEPLAMKPGITVVTEERELAKAYFLLAVEGPDAASPDYFPFALLSAYLADGNAALLRDELVTKRELLDDLSMAALPRRYPQGWQSIDGEGQPEKLADAVSALWEILAQVNAGAFTDDDVELARKRLIAAHGVESDDQYQVASALVESDAHGDYRLFSDYADRLAAVSRADVQAVARKYLTPDRFFLMATFPTGRTPAGFEDSIRGEAGGQAAADGGITSRTLPSGATLLHESRPGATVESFTVAVEAGDRDGSKAGLAEAVAEMMARQTKALGKKELQDFLDRNGFRLSSWTTADGAFFSLQAPPGATAKAAKLLTDVLTAPAFPEDEWESVRAEILARLDAQLDQPPAVARDALETAVFGGTAYGRSIADRRTDVAALTTRDLQSFWKKRYRAGSLAVCYCGDASADQVADALAPLDAIEGQAPSRDAIAGERPDGEVRVARPMEGKTQANLFVAWPVPPVASDDWIRWQLAEKAIGGDLAGRLWKLRQDEGLAYSVWMEGGTRRDHSITYVYMATAAEKREKALAAIHREIRRAVDGLTPEELDRVKVSYLASLNRLDRTAERRSNRMAQWWSLGLAPDRRDRLERVVAGTTREDVNRVVAEVLDPERYHFAEAGTVPE